MTKTEMLMSKSAGVGRIKKPDVIYCRDCKYYETMFCVMDIWTEEVTIYKAKPDDFCSRAKRREE